MDRIWRVLALVEERPEEPRTVCERPSLRICSWWKEAWSSVERRQQWRKRLVGWKLAHFVVVVLNDSLCRWHWRRVGRCRICCVMVGLISSSAGFLICGTSVLLCLPTMEQGTVAPMLQRDAQHACCVDVSVCGVRRIGHIRVMDNTLVKSSKVGTILLRNHHAKLHVIACAIASVHWEVPVQAANSEWVCDTRNGPPRTQGSCLWRRSWRTTRWRNRIAMQWGM